MRLHEGRDSVSDIALSILVAIVTHGARLQVSIIELKGPCGNVLAGRLLGSSRARIEDLVELGFCRFLKAGMQRIACVVHQVVEPVASPALQQTPSGIVRQASTLRSEEHTSELQSRQYLVCRLLLEKKKKKKTKQNRARRSKYHRW